MRFSDKPVSDKPGVTLYDLNFIPKHGVLKDCVEASYLRRRVLWEGSYLFTVGP